jgi:hypothetical protein
MVCHPERLRGQRRLPSSAFTVEILEARLAPAVAGMIAHGYEGDATVGFAGSSREPLCVRTPLEFQKLTAPTRDFSLPGLPPTKSPSPGGGVAPILAAA